MTLKASLIIAVYKRHDFLSLVFDSISLQVFRDFEVIVAEDDCAPQIAETVANYRELLDVPIQHLSQENNGFRKNRILNRATAAARGESLVYIDGDCLLHHLFLREHMRRARHGTCLFGRRVMLSPNLTRKLLTRSQFDGLDLWSILASRSTQVKYALYLPGLPTLRPVVLHGCNFCVSRADMLAINGFDEDFTEPFFGEDTDIARRLRLNGVALRSVRHTAIQYHLHHDTGDRRRSWQISEDLYRARLTNPDPRCANGIDKHAAVSEPPDRDSA